MGADGHLVVTDTTTYHRERHRERHVLVRLSIVCAVHLEILLLLFIRATARSLQMCLQAIRCINFLSFHLVVPSKLALVSIRLTNLNFRSGKERNNCKHFSLSELKSSTSRCQSNLSPFMPLFLIVVLGIFECKTKCWAAGDTRYKSCLLM